MIYGILFEIGGLFLILKEFLVSNVLIFLNILSLMLVKVELVGLLVFVV